MQRPSGTLIEEYKTASQHLFHNGKLQGHIHNSADGEYTGRIAFEFTGGKITKWYTQKTAPKWLLSLYDEATGAEPADPPPDAASIEARWG